MRMATAMDEIAPLRDLRVRGNQAYLAVILLSRVITRLGTLPMISTAVIENLYVADLAYLQALYRRINEEGKTTVHGHLPGVPDETRGGSCRAGGVVGYPLDRLQEEVAYLAYHFHWSLERYSGAGAQRAAAVGETGRRHQSQAE